MMNVGSVVLLFCLYEKYVLEKPTESPVDVHVLKYSVSVHTVRVILKTADFSALLSLLQFAGLKFHS